MFYDFAKPATVCSVYVRIYHFNCISKKMNYLHYSWRSALKRNLNTLCCPCMPCGWLFLWKHAWFLREGRNGVLVP